MKKLLSVVALSALLASSHAMAGKNYEPVESDVVPVDVPNPFYVGIGANWTGVSRDCPCDGSRIKDSTYGEILRVGYDFNPFFGIEARALQANLGINFAKTTHYGVYLKPQYHFTPLMNVYGLVGYGHTEVKCVASQSAIGSQDFKKNGFSFGAGIEYDLSGDQGIQGDEEEGWGLFADWQNLAYKDSPQNTNVNVVSAGITYDF